MKNYAKIAQTYAQQVTKGKILVCQYVRQACQRFLDDLVRKKWRYEFDAKKANRACRFVELLPHTKGRWAAKQELLLLQPWQIFILANLFGWVDKKTRLRRFREGYLEVARKNGKSILAAGVGLYMFAADGDHGAEVYSGATTEKQAWEIFRPARLIALRTSDLRETYGIEVNASNLNILANGSRFEPLIGNPGDGASPSCALIDEYHEHLNDNLYETMVTGMGAREQPLSLVVTTAGSNLAGPCYSKRAEMIQILEGAVKAETIFGMIYTIDDEEKWTTREALKMANPNFGVSVSEDYLLDRQQQAMRNARLTNSFKTKHLNIWVGAATAWLDMVKWRQQPARKSLEELEGRPCFIGLDLAAKRDLVAMVLVFPPVDEDEPFHVHGRYYLPEDSVTEYDTGNTSLYEQWSKEGYLTLTAGPVVDYDVILEDLQDYCRQYSVQSVGYDPAYAWNMAVAMMDSGIPAVEIQARTLNFSEPMKKIEALVYEKKLAHGNCPALTWQMSNVRAKEDKKDNIYPLKDNDRSKIDGAVALIMAMNRVLLQEDTGSVYDQRGLISV